MSSLRHFLVLALIACSSAPAEAPPRAPTATRMGVHGMVLFGGPRQFLSHLPMYHPPHDAQLVLEVRTAGDGLPAAFSDQLYTIEPERFGLDSLRDGTRTRFTATVYRGNFEQGGVPIARGVAFEVVRVVLDRPLAAGDAIAAAPEYLALGQRGAVALVHLLGGAPGFDHVVTARLDGDGLTDDQLARGVRVSLPGAGNTPETRAGAGAVAGTVDGRPVSLTITAELSCLVGPDFTEPCPPTQRGAPTR
jgi:hypothetical protein